MPIFTARDSNKDNLHAPLTSIFSRIFLGASQLSLIGLAANNLTQVEQGYFTTARSLLAAQTVIDLGLSIVLVQLVAHEYKDDQLSESAKHRLRNLFRFAAHWYACAAFAMFLIVGMGGLFLFSNSSQLNAESMLVPWALTVLIASFSLLINPLQSFTEGIGNPLSMALMRALQAAAGAIAFGLATALGFGLWGLPAMTGASLIVGISWIAARHSQQLEEYWRQESDIKLSWKIEVLPFQWRIAVSWICGWIIYQLYVPVLFSHHGPVIAGQMGLSLEACAGITSLGAAWVGIKSPAWGKLVAQGNFSELDRQYQTSNKHALYVVIAAVIMFGISIAALNWLEHPIAKRFLPLYILAPLLLTAIINQIVFGMATYLRAHKREPYLAPTVVGALTLGTRTLTTGSLFGAAGMAYAHLTVASIVGWAWGLWIFRRCKKSWHTPALTPGG